MSKANKKERKKLSNVNWKKGCGESKDEWEWRRFNGVYIEKKTQQESVRVRER